MLKKEMSLHDYYYDLPEELAEWRIYLAETRTE